VNALAESHDPSQSLCFSFCMMNSDGDDEELCEENKLSVSTPPNILRETASSQKEPKDRRSAESPPSTPSHPPKKPIDLQSIGRPPSLGTGSRSLVFKESPSNAESQFFSKPMRRRSSLFETLPSRSRTRNEMSASSLHQGNSPSTILDDDFQSTLFLPSGENPPSQGKRKSSSLFGAVMKRFGAAVGSPVKNPMPTTPTRNSQLKMNSGDESGAGLTSPTGKSIMNFVKTFVNSPFRFQSPKSKRKDMDRTEASAIPCVTKTPSPCRKRRRLDMSNEDSRSSLKENENWQEVPIDEKQMKIVDYSLRTKLSVECHTENHLRSLMAREDFQENLSYWQYPATPMVSLSLQCDDSKVVEQSKKRLDGEQSKKRLDEGGNGDTAHLDQTDCSMPLTPSDLAKKLTRLVRGDKAVLSRTNGGSTMNGLSTLGSQREWQEAFRSVYLNWCRKAEALMKNEESSDTALDTYFYCVAHDHVVVFRLDEAKGREAAPNYLPRVIVSSFTQFFRGTLESMGVEGIEVFHEQSKKAAGGTSTATRQRSTPMSPNVKADLEALRRAQAYGENVGADFFVKQQKKATQKSNSDYERLPLSVSGLDNVSIFFEVYLNLLGRIASPSARKEALPTIYCRNVGPFLHASMKSLKVWPVKSKETDSVEVEGMILPCSVRKMVGHLAADFVKGVGQSQNQRFLQGDAGITGYMVVQAVTEKEPSHPLKMLKDSATFNGWGNGIKEEQADASSNECYECENGKAVQLVVWDASSKNVVACNIE
jgi:hypothetical protein